MVRSANQRSARARLDHSFTAQPKAPAMDNDESQQAWMSEDCVTNDIATGIKPEGHFMSEQFGNHRKVNELRSPLCITRPIPRTTRIH